MKPILFLTLLFSLNAGAQEKYPSHFCDSIIRIHDSIDALPRMKYFIRVGAYNLSEPQRDSAMQMIRNMNLNIAVPCFLQKKRYWEEQLKYSQRELDSLKKISHD